MLKRTIISAEKLNIKKLLINRFNSIGHSSYGSTIIKQDIRFFATDQHDEKPKTFSNELFIEEKAVIEMEENSGDEKEALVKDLSLISENFSEEEKLKAISKLKKEQLAILAELLQKYQVLNKDLVSEQGGKPTPGAEEKKSLIEDFTINNNENLENISSPIKNTVTEEQAIENKLANQEKDDSPDLPDTYKSDEKIEFKQNSQESDTDTRNYHSDVPIEETNQKPQEPISTINQTSNQSYSKESFQIQSTNSYPTLDNQLIYDFSKYFRDFSVGVLSTVTGGLILALIIYNLIEKHKEKRDFYDKILKEIEAIEKKILEHFSSFKIYTTLSAIDESAKVEITDQEKTQLLIIDENLQKLQPLYDKLDTEKNNSSGIFNSINLFIDNFTENQFVTSNNNSAILKVKLENIMEFTKQMISLNNFLKHRKMNNTQIKEWGEELLTYFNKSQKLKSIVDNKLFLLAIYNKQSILLKINNNHQESIQKLEQAIRCISENESSRAINTTSDINRWNNSIMTLNESKAIIQSNLAVMYTMYTKSAELDQKAYELHQNALNYLLDNSAVLNGMGVYYLTKENYQLANTYFSKALHHDPENKIVLCNRAWVYTNMGQYNLALPDIQKAYKIDPTDKNVIFLYAVCMYNDVILNKISNIKFWSNKQKFYNEVEQLLKIIDQIPNESRLLSKTMVDELVVKCQNKSKNYYHIDVKKVFAHKFPEQIDTEAQPTLSPKL